MSINDITDVVEIMIPKHIQQTANRKLQTGKYQLGSGLSKTTAVAVPSLFKGLFDFDRIHTLCFKSNTSESGCVTWDTFFLRRFDYQPLSTPINHLNSEQNRASLSEQTVTRNVTKASVLHQRERLRLIVNASTETFRA